MTVIALQSCRVEYSIESSTRRQGMEIVMYLTVTQHTKEVNSKFPSTISSSSYN